MSSTFRSLPVFLSLSLSLLLTVGPVIGSFTTQALGWRWSLWPLLFSSGAALVLAVIGLPETSSNTILLRRAKRLREMTGNDRLRSQGEIISENMTMKEVGAMTLYRPIKLMVVGEFRVSSLEVITSARSKRCSQTFSFSTFLLLSPYDLDHQNPSFSS